VLIPSPLSWPRTPQATSGRWLVSPDTLDRVRELCARQPTGASAGNERVVATELRRKLRVRERITELTAQYVDLPLGIVGASVVALAERRGLEVIATLDQRHFRAVGPKHIDAFTLVP
jgi:predicted nucleic acid-binding protein